MIDPCKQQRLYPTYDQSFLEHFSSVYDSVFLGFFPFFKLKDRGAEGKAFSKSVETSLEDVRKQDETFKKMEATGATIYSRNPCYPEEHEISQQGIIVTWEDVRDGAGLIGNSDLYKALKTTIGAYNEDFSRPDLAIKLQRFVQKAQIWLPGEGQFDVLTLRKIYNCFVLLEHTHIIVEDEFHETCEEYNLGLLTVEKFIEAIGGKDYYIYSRDKSILFSVDWDSFFFIVCSTSPIITKIIADQNIEGFFADALTTHSWEHD